MEQQTDTEKAKQLYLDDLERQRQATLKEIKDGSSILFGSLPKELFDDEEIALAAIHRHLWNGRYVSDRLKRNREFVLVAVKVKGHFLGHATAELRGDFEVVLAAVQQNGFALEDASELRGHRQIVLAAVQENSYSLQFASEELRGDRQIVLAAVRQRGAVLKLASEELRGNREVVMEAVRQEGYALRYASVELRGDREIVLAALTGRAGSDVYRCGPVRYMSIDIQNDPVVAGAIIRKRGHMQSGSEIVDRLDGVLPAVRALPEAFVDHVVNEASVMELCLRWEYSIWNKIWLALQLEPPGMEGTGRLFVVLSGLPSELHQVNELRYCAPVIGAFLSLSQNGEDWRYLESYPVRDHDDQGDY